MNEDFLLMKPGSIGHIGYIYKINRKISDKKKQQIMDETTAEYVRGQITRMAVEGHSDLDNAYQKARQQAKKIIKQNEEIQAIKHIHVQVNQKESFNEIVKIENDVNFVKWLDPNLIDRFKSTYKNQISNK